MLARAYVADAVHDVATRVLGRSQAWGVEPDALAGAMPFVAEHRAPAFLETLADQCAKHGTGPDASLRRLRARRRDVPPLRRRQDPPRRRARAPHQRRRARRRSSRAWPSSAGSACRCPRSTAGSRPAASPTTWAWSSRPRSCHAVRSASAARSSPGPRSSTRALVAGGTEEQKQTWLPRIASGELMVGIMVTEPDFGSDVARREGHRDADRRRLARERREDLGDVRRSRRRADAARAHRPRPHRPSTAACRSSSSRSRAPKATRSRSTTGAAARPKAARSTRSATAACTPTRSRSTTGSCPARISSAAKPGSAAASTSRWPASRTGGSRPRRAPSG